MGLMSKKASTKVLKFISPGSWSLVLAGRISSHVVNLKFLSPGLRLFVLRVVVLGGGGRGVILWIYLITFFTVGHLQTFLFMVRMGMELFNKYSKILDPWHVVLELLLEGGRVLIINWIYIYTVTKKSFDLKWID